jgi:hypothetical protein
MKTGKLSRIISLNLRRNRKNLIFSSVGIVVGISSFFFFIALGHGIKHTVATEIWFREPRSSMHWPGAASSTTRPYGSSGKLPA